MIAAALFVLAQYRSTLTLGDRTELRARTTHDTTGVAGTPPAFDVSTQPSATAVLNNHRWEHTLLYSPMLTFRSDALPGTTPDLLHTAGARTAWHTKRVLITLAETGTYGTRNFADLAGPSAAANADGTTPPPAPLQLLPANTSVQFGSTSTTLNSTVVPARRWSFTNGIGYSVSGGVDSASQLAIALRRAARFETTLTYAASRRDRVFTTIVPSTTALPGALCDVPVGAPVSTTPPALCDRLLELAEVGEGWRRQWARHTSTALLVGASLRRVRLSQKEAFTHTIGPLGSAEITQLYPLLRGRLRLQVVGRLGPLVDQRTGIIETRMDDVALGEWTYGPTTVRGSLQYTQSVPATASTAVRAVQAEARGARRLSRRFDVEVGYRMLQQEQFGITSLTTNAFVALVYHEPRILF